MERSPTSRSDLRSRLRLPNGCGGVMEHLMSDAIIVLNGGSSSLKFSIHQIPEHGEEPVAVARGQVDGLGTKPHFKVQDRTGAALADTALVAGFGEVRPAVALST